MLEAQLTELAVTGVVDQNVTRLDLHINNNTSRTPKDDGHEVV